MKSDLNGSGSTTGCVNGAGSSPASGSDKVVADIVNLITSTVKARHEEYRKVNGADIPTRLSGNSLECLATCEDVETLGIVVEPGPPSYGSPSVSDVLDPTIVGVVSPLSGIGSLDSYKPGPTSGVDFRTLLLSVKRLKISR